MHDLLPLAGTGRRKAWMWKGGVPKAAGGAPVPAVSTAPTAPPKSDRRETRRSENHVVKRRKREAAFPVVGSPQEAVGAGQGKRRGSYRIPVSKAMTKVLRHRARHIDAAGWVSLKALLDSPELKRLKADSVQVMEAVDDNDKQRFEKTMKDGMTFIRATQGHSLSNVRADLVGQRLDADEVPEYAVHGTYRRHWRSICLHGLIAGGVGRSQRNDIHLIATTLEDLQWTTGTLAGYRGDAEILLVVKTGEAAREHGIAFNMSANNVLLTAMPLPPSLFYCAIAVGSGRCTRIF